jgi:hypothetical protein
MNLKFTKLFLVLALMFVQLLACAIPNERSTKVRLEGGNPPTFVLSGSGELSDLVIYGPKQRDIIGDRAFAVWEIKPINGHEGAESIESLSPIKYGSVPKNYIEVYPGNGASAPPLIEGEKYQYWFQTINAPHARGYFEIRNGKPVETPSQ